MKSLFIGIVVAVFALSPACVYADPCATGFDDEMHIYDFLSWLPEYPLGFTPRHPLKNTFIGATVVSWASDVVYPGKMGTTVGVNDTIAVGARAVNASSSPLVISNLNIESWFRCAVFEIGDNIETSLPLASAPFVKWRVRRWQDIEGELGRPDTIKADQEYMMILDVWDVPEGKYQLGILGTDSVPSWFDVMPSGDFYHLLPAQDLADSINAWATIADRVMADGNPGGAAQWLDSIFTHNNKSLVGYYQQAKYFWAKEDSANTVASFDSVLQRIKNWDDPALPDTTSPLFDNINLKWKHFMHDLTTREREIYINCPELR